jgi:hypothetical protein
LPAVISTSTGNLTGRAKPASSEYPTCPSDLSRIEIAALPELVLDLHGLF